MPDAEGVPLIVIVLDAHAAVTPVGKPEAVPIPVAPVVVCVMLLASGVFTQSVGVADAALTLKGFTITAPDMLLLTETGEQPEGVEFTIQ